MWPVKSFIQIVLFMPPALEHCTVFFIKKYNVAHRGMRGDNSMGEALKLDKIYVCKQCNASFLFMSDMTEHYDDTNHKGMFEMSFEPQL